jgi:hypothetical protein
MDGPTLVFEKRNKRQVASFGMIGFSCDAEGRPAQECDSLREKVLSAYQKCQEEASTPEARARALAKLPDATEEKARALAASFSGCNNPRFTCELETGYEPGRWVFDIVYLKLPDKAAESWVQQFGKSRIVVGSKGQVVESRSIDSNRHR